MNRYTFVVVTQHKLDKAALIDLADHLGDLIEHEDIEIAGDFEVEMIERFPALAEAMSRVTAGIRERGLAQPTDFTITDGGVRIGVAGGHGFTVAQVLEAAGFQCTSLNRDAVFFDPHPEQLVGPRYSIVTGQWLT